MNIKLLKAYEEARELRESRKRIPMELLQKIDKLEHGFISKEFLPCLEDLVLYFLQGYESPLSLKLEFYPEANDVFIEDVTSRTQKQSVKDTIQQPFISSGNTKTPKVSRKTVNALNSYVVEPSIPQRPIKTVPNQSTTKKTTQSEKSSTINNRSNNVDDDIKKYYDDFKRMKRRPGAMGAKKAVMLLSMFDLIGCGYFKTNEIVLDDTLITKFESLWDNLKPLEKRGPKDVYKAFVQLFREPFYRLKLNEGKSCIEIDGDWNIETVRKTIKCVSFDGILFRLVQNNQTCNHLTDYLADLFGLVTIAPPDRNISGKLSSKKGQILEDGFDVFDENFDEVDINDFLLYSKVNEYNQDEVANSKPSDLWSAVAIASLGNKKKSYIIYDASMQPLTKDRIIKFMLKAMITRDLLSYRYGNEVSERIHNPNGLDIIDSLLKCTIFQEVDPNTGKKTDYQLAMNRSIKGFQIYTEFRNLTQKVYDCLMGDKHQELPNEFNRFVKNVAKQAFIL